LRPPQSPSCPYTTPFRCPAQGGDLAVGQPEPVAVGREPRGLGEPRLVRGAVDQALVGGPGRHRDGAGARVEGPQLVDAGHRDPHPVLPPRHGPRAGEPRGSVAGSPLLAVAGEGGDGAVGEAYAAQGVVDRVGDDQVVADRRGEVVGERAQAVGLTEPRLLRATVGEPALARPDPAYDGPGV